MIDINLKEVFEAENLICSHPWFNLFEIFILWTCVIFNCLILSLRFIKGSKKQDILLVFFLLNQKVIFAWWLLFINFIFLFVLTLSVHVFLSLVSHVFKSMIELMMVNPLHERTELSKTQDATDWGEADCDAFWVLLVVGSCCHKLELDPDLITKLRLSSVKILNNVSSFLDKECSGIIRIVCLVEWNFESFFNEVDKLELHLNLPASIDGITLMKWKKDSTFWNYGIIFIISLDISSIADSTKYQSSTSNIITFIAWRVHSRVIGIRLFKKYFKYFRLREVKYALVGKLGRYERRIFNTYPSVVG